MSNGSITIRLGAVMTSTVAQIRGQTCVADLKPGETAQIISLETSNQTVLRKIMALGVFPGSSLRVLRCFPVFVLEIGYTRIAIDREIASNIYVHR